MSEIDYHFKGKAYFNFLYRMLQIIANEPKIQSSLKFWRPISPCEALLFTIMKDPSDINSTILVDNLDTILDFRISPRSLIQYEKSH